MQIKGYFGQQIPQLKKSLLRMLSKRGAAENVEANLEDDEEEMY